MAQPSTARSRRHATISNVMLSRREWLSSVGLGALGARAANDVWRDAMPEAVTLPQHFMQNGYEVIGGGKTFHNTLNEASSWHYYKSFRGFLKVPGFPVNGLNNGNFDWSSFDVQQ